MKVYDFGTELEVYRENGYWFDFIRGSKCVMLGLEPNLEKHLKVLGRGLLGQKGARNAFSWHPSEKHLVYGLFEKISEAKKLPDIEKTTDLSPSYTKLHHSNKMWNNSIQQ